LRLHKQAAITGKPTRSNGPRGIFPPWAFSKSGKAKSPEEIYFLTSWAYSICLPIFAALMVNLLFPLMRKIRTMRAFSVKAEYRFP
jgi:hypothetical protein